MRPSALTLAHIDAYYASHGTHQREGARAFLVWAAQHGHIPRHLDAQPLSRILRLTTADLARDDGQTWLHLGDPPSPVPPPFDALLHQLAATRHHHVPANHGSDWLFPGRHAGQPADYRSIAAQLRDLDLPLRTARISALRQLVLQVPAPVIADALGFHHTTTTRQRVNAGATWSRYAGGGDHQG